MTSVTRGTKKSPGLVCDYILSIIRNGLDEHNLIETMHIFLFDYVNDISQNWIIVAKQDYLCWPLLWKGSIP